MSKSCYSISKSLSASTSSGEAKGQNSKKRDKQSTRFLSGDTDESNFEGSDVDNSSRSHKYASASSFSEKTKSPMLKEGGSQSKRLRFIDSDQSNTGGSDVEGDNDFSNIRSQQPHFGASSGKSKTRGKRSKRLKFIDSDDSDVEKSDLEDISDSFHSKKSKSVKVHSSHSKAKNIRSRVEKSLLASSAREAKGQKSKQRGKHSKLLKANGTDQSNEECSDVNDSHQNISSKPASGSPTDLPCQGLRTSNASSNSKMKSGMNLSSSSFFSSFFHA